MGNPPLTGTRIIDLSNVLAGPYATLLLSLLGAEVIRIESKEYLDMIRRRDIGQFNDLNVNKLSITINLKKRQGVNLVKKLVATSDVVVEAFRPGVIERLGLGYSVLKEVKHDIIMASFSGFGQTGPEAHHYTYAAIFSAMGGLAHITGHADGIPTEQRGPIDLRCGQIIAFAILPALLYRQRTGEGQYIDVCGREGIICEIGDVVMEYVMNRRDPGRRGNRDDAMVPHNCYHCLGQDSWVSIAIADDAEWKALCHAMGQETLVEDERFVDVLSRLRNHQELDKIITQWTSQNTDYGVMEILQRVGVAAMPVMNAAQIFNDPHLKAREYIQEVEHPELGKRMLFGPPWKLSKTPATIRRHAPLLGEHNKYVLHDLLGLSLEEIARLESEKVLY
jgi:crotonobetainyl-CoA:carnitine CoA-transferase CaiB-like acyl-CoA transferase